MFMVNIIEEIAGKLRISILLHFELITARFAYVRDRNLTCSCFLDIWNTWEPLFMDLNIKNYFKKYKKETVYGNNISGKLAFGNYKFWNLRKKGGSRNGKCKFGVTNIIGVSERFWKKHKNGKLAWWNLNKSFEILKHIWWSWNLSQS